MTTHVHPSTQPVFEPYLHALTDVVPAGELQLEPLNEGLLSEVATQLKSPELYLHLPMTPHRSLDQLLERFRVNHPGLHPEPAERVQLAWAVRQRETGFLVGVVESPI